MSETPAPSNPIDHTFSLIDEKALNGFSFCGITFDGAEQFARSARSKGADLDRQIGWMVNQSMLQAGAIGAVTGLGGFLAMPITLPSNIVATMVVQLRLCYAIAILCDFSLSSPQVKACAQMVAMGAEAGVVLKELAVKVLTKQVTKMIAARMVQDASRRVATRAIEKAAASASTRWVPGLGALIGAAVDSTATWLVARQARKLFAQGDPKEAGVAVSG